MKKIYFLLFLSIFSLSGCSDRNLFLFSCVTKGFWEYKDVNINECRCVVDKLAADLSIDEYKNLNNLLRNGQTPMPNSFGDIAMREAGRLCINPLKKGI